MAAHLLYVALARGALLTLVVGLLLVTVPGSYAPAGQGLPKRDRAASREGDGRGSSTCWRPKDAELEFAHRMNLARVEAARVGLRLDPELSAVARRHTRRMVAHGQLTHSPTRLLRRRVTRWSVLAENVGVGSAPSELHAAFMSSDVHRKNVLARRFRHVGIGTRKNHGRMWVTMIFEARRDPGTRLRMPEC